MITRVIITTIAGGLLIGGFTVWWLGSRPPQLPAMSSDCKTALTSAAKILRLQQGEQSFALQVGPVANQSDSGGLDERTVMLPFANHPECVQFFTLENINIVAPPHS